MVRGVDEGHVAALTGDPEEGGGALVVRAGQDPVQPGGVGGEREVAEISMSARQLVQNRRNSRSGPDTSPNTRYVSSGA